VKLQTRLALCGAVILLLAAGVCAQESIQQRRDSAHDLGQVIIPSVTPTPNLPITGSSGGLQLAIYLGLLLALLGGGSYFLKNGFNFLPPKSKGVRKLNVAETRMLGNRQFLVVAEYEGRRMLLGVCPGRIELLSDLGGKSDEPFAAHLNET
jgi:flagellar protein FliO/FliZ